MGERITHLWSVFAVLAVGCVAYGFSIFVYVYTQRLLGAARTSAFYAIAPFIGALLSLLIFKQMPPHTFFIALALMAVGAWLCSSDEPIVNMINSISPKKWSTFKSEFEQMSTLMQSWIDQE